MEKIHVFSISVRNHIAAGAGAVCAWGGVDSSDLHTCDQVVHCSTELECPTLFADLFKQVLDLLSHPAIGVVSLDWRLCFRWCQVIPTFFEEPTYFGKGN